MNVIHLLHHASIENAVVAGDKSALRRHAREMMADLFTCTGELVTDLARGDIHLFPRRNLEPFRDEFPEVPHPFHARATRDPLEICRFVILRERWTWTDKGAFEAVRSVTKDEKRQ